MTVRVVLIDDQELVRVGLCLLLDAQPDIEVVGEASDGVQLLSLLDSVEADVVVMDLRMPIMNGIEATRLLCAERSSVVPRVLVLTTFDDEDDAFAALQAGASGFLLKSAPPSELIAAIHIVAGGDAIVSPRITRRLLDRYAAQFGSPRFLDRRLVELTAREHEVVVLIAHGLSNAEIGERLSVAEATVKSHVRRILTKLELRDRVQIVVLAYEAGLVRPTA